MKDRPHYLIVSRKSYALTVTIPTPETALSLDKTKYLSKQIPIGSDLDLAYKEAEALRDQMLVSIWGEHAEHLLNGAVGRWSRALGAAVKKGRKIFRNSNSYSVDVVKITDGQAKAHTIARRRMGCRSDEEAMRLVRLEYEKACDELVNELLSDPLGSLKYF